MASSYGILLLIILCFYAIEAQQFQTAKLIVNTSISLGKQIPNTFMGVFFEEINHAGVGGLWAELVSNRGFEAGGENDPSNIYPWTIVGAKSLIQVSIDQTSCFERNKNALKMEVQCDDSCGPDGVGISNPDFWGMVRPSISYALGHIEGTWFSHRSFSNGGRLETKNIKISWWMLCGR
ncbi:unnamed protein product [Trifolium pratense]|uniref:Uncharacterized protein n=1 Tax=Trifolium pratense TaxID=57577 RepID=A0ACB0IZK9_TRIPR|nr:unnamed protein product [Trifolium pratense]